MNLEATDIKETSVVLSWNLPEINGGSEVTHYIVEKREIDRKTWATVKAEVQLDKIPLKVSGLMPGTEYYFRVTAVNEYGSGVPRVTPTSYLASDPVSKYLFNHCTSHEKEKFMFSLKLYTALQSLKSFFPLKKSKQPSTHPFLFQASLTLVKKLKFWK